MLSSFSTSRFKTLIIFILNSLLVLISCSFFNLVLLFILSLDHELFLLLKFLCISHCQIFCLKADLSVTVETEVNSISAWKWEHVIFCWAFQVKGCMNRIRSGTEFIIIVLLSNFRFLYCCLVLGLAIGLLETFCFTFSFKLFLYIWTSERSLLAVLTFSGKQTGVAFDSGPDRLMGEMFLTSIRQAVSLVSRVGLFQWPCPFPRTRIPLLFSREGNFSLPVIPMGLCMGQLQAYLPFLQLLSFCFIMEKDLDGTLSVFF